MRRMLTVLLVLVTAPGLATAGLLRPCDCEQEAAAACHAGSAPAETAPPPACCCHEDGPERTAPSTPEPADDDCGICCKPPAPMERAEAPPVTRTPALVAVPAPATTSWAVPPAAREVRPSVAVAHGDPPWRLAPEGLAVFLD